MFEVQEYLLTSTLRFHEKYLDFQITFSDKNNMRTSGDVDDDTPKVLSYPIIVVQKARLYLIEDWQLTMNDPQFSINAIGLNYFTP